MVDENLKKLQVLFRMLAIGLGMLHVYAAIKSQSMNADGISYLDIGDAYFRADWVNAINPVWSPLYSWILGFANFIIRPSMQWEFPVVHLVNFIIYLIALSSFEFMWKRIRSYEASNESYVIHDFWWWTLGYLLFIWISLSLIEVWAVTPDMLMEVFVFLAAGLIAGMRAKEGNRWSFASLGLILGLGYLSKSFMFFIAIVFLAIAWLVQKRSQRKILLAAGIFVLISLPFTLLISEKRGKFTIGEAGTVTYLRYVNGMPFPHWQGDPQRGIILTHPSRIVHQSPPVYEFSGPIGGTYPISTDPSYWYEGVEPRFDIKGLFARLLASGSIYAELFLHQQGILVACIFALYMMRQGGTYTLHETLKRWVLIIPALIAFGLYGTVLVEGRYVGVFILLFWADILANVRLPNAPVHGLWLGALSSIAAFGLLANIILFNLDGFTRLNPSWQSGLGATAAPAAKPLAVARALQELGVRQGDKVGVIGYAYDSFWARLARVRIVAELLEVDEFWRGDEALRQSVLQAFASTGAKAVILEDVPGDAYLEDCYRVGKSNYYIYVFAE
jgi:4-amino-4-deoxy-L-arabinose transferase-like glycosyltransferase